MPGALAAAGGLPAGLAFRSGNWGWINQVMAPLGVPCGLRVFLFAGAIGWEALAGGLPAEFRRLTEHGLVALDAVMSAGRRDGHADH